MNARQLGKNGFTIGEMGIGCWQFGGDWGPLDDATAIAILEEAAGAGVNFIDTADVYGAGRSETLIGRFLQRHGGRFVIATKFGRAGNVYPDKYSRAVLRESVAGSLQRLGVAALDLLQLHCIPLEVLRRGEVFDWLRELRQEGLIKHFGASVESIEEGLLCLEQDGLLALQVIFNLFRQKPADELLPKARAAGVGIIVRLPLASGLLAGKFTVQSRFPATDHRHYNRDGQAFNVGETFAGLPFAKGVELAAELKPFAPPGMTLAQLAQRWILDHDAVSVIIPGASTPVQARSNAAVSGLPPLTPGLHRELREFYLQKVRDHIRGPY